MRLTASSKNRKEACAYEKVCAYKKGALNNPSLQYMHFSSVSASIPETGWATLFDFETSKKMGGV